MTYRRWLTSIFAFLLTAFTLAVLAVVWASSIVRAPSFPGNLPDATLQVQERAFHLGGVHCDVLIFGDSTALTGVDPQVIQADTGLSACNIAATRPIVDALGMLPVDEFLAHNPRPKFLVLQFGPEVFYRTGGWDNNTGVAPIAMLLRNRPGWSTTWTMVTHPIATIHFCQVILESRLFPPKEELVRFHKVYKKPFEDYKANGGLLTLVLPPLHLCVDPPLPLLGPVDTRWAGSLRNSYKVRGITVLVKASPLAECDPQLRFFQSALAPYVDSNVQAMPVRYFVSGGRHMTLEGAEAETHNLASLIRSRQEVSAGK